MKKAALVITPVLILIVIGIFFLKSRSDNSVELSKTPLPTTNAITLPENQEKEIQVDLTAKTGNKAVILKVTEITKEVTSIEYELSYLTGKGIPKGVLGKIDHKTQQTSLQREILLGTCSRNVCTYDEGVTKVSLTLKFNKSTGQNTGFSKEYEL